MANHCEGRIVVVLQNLRERPDLALVHEGTRIFEIAQ